MKQLDLLAQCDEVDRLNGQCLKILQMLRGGVTSNSALAGVSLKYTGRISDLRKRGYDIRCVEMDRKTGISLYQLFE